MITFDSEAIYVNSGLTKLSRVAKLKIRAIRIEAIIDALEVAALNAASNGSNEYMLNDGQTIIKTVSRTPKQISDAIHEFEKILQGIVNELNGRMVRLVDSRNFTGNRYGI